MWNGEKQECSASSAFCSDISAASTDPGPESSLRFKRLRARNVAKSGVAKTES